MCIREILQALGRLAAAIPPVLAAWWRLYRLAVRDGYRARRRRDVP